MTPGLPRPPPLSIEVMASSVLQFCWVAQRFGGDDVTAGPLGWAGAGVAAVVAYHQP